MRTVSLRNYDIFFFQYSTLSRDDIEILQERYDELLASLRPNAVGLVDSFDIRDEVNASIYTYFAY